MGRTAASGGSKATTEYNSSVPDVSDKKAFPGGVQAAVSKQKKEGPGWQQAMGAGIAAGLSSLDQQPQGGGGAPADFSTQPVALDPSFYMPNNSYAQMGQQFYQPYQQQPGGFY